MVAVVLLLLVIVAFSGVGFATSVSDKGSKITTPLNYNADCDNERHVYSWETVYYNTNHMQLKMFMREQKVTSVRVNGKYKDKWVNWNNQRHTYTVSCTRINSNHLKIVTKVYNNGKYIGGDVQSLKTKHSVYYTYKRNVKHNINYFIKYGDRYWM